MIYIDDGETLQMSREEYEELKEALDFLACLEACGVDNWDGYDYARDMYAEEYNNAN